MEKNQKTSYGIESQGTEKYEEHNVNNFLADLQASTLSDLDRLTNDTNILETPKKGTDSEESQLSNIEILLLKLKSVKVDIHAELPPPPVALAILNGQVECTVGTLGNFSLVIGKAKSRKTFAITMALAGACIRTPVLDKFIGYLPEKQRRVALFDTEQGSYHVQKVCKRVVRLVGHEPENFEAFGLRKFSPVERLAMIEAFIYSHSDLGFVVIDGVRDLISSINDEEQATAITSKFLKWTEERNIHIICLLHQNKGDNNARGHIGSELVNKAETVLSITKDNDISVVKADFCRDIEPTPFGFTIDSDGLPMIVEHYELKVDSKSKKTLSPSDVSEESHLQVLRLVFELNNQPKFKELCANIKERFETLGTKFGRDKSENFLTYYLNNDYISKIENGSKSYYVLQT